MTHLLSICIILILTISSCSNDIVQPDDCDSNIPGQLDMMVLCEGLYGFDNASLWGIGKSESADLFSCKNGRKLGDTANDLIKISDSLNIIIVSTSNEIIKVSNQGKIVSSYQVKGPGHFLKKACNVNDSLIAITDLYGDKVYVFNHVAMSLDSLNITKLCAPDGIAYGEGYLVIANSGYGVFRKDELNAGTITIYDVNTKSSRFVKTGINPQNVTYDRSAKRWMIQYAHLTTLPDSTGGLVVLNQAFTELYHLRGQYMGIQVRKLENTYALCGKSIIRINDSGNVLDTLLVNNTRNQWYRIGLIQNRLYICNARNYTLPGSVLLLNDQSTMIEREMSVGINPSIVIESN
jgi:hypothetical protein